MYFYQSAGFAAPEVIATRGQSVARLPGAVLSPLALQLAELITMLCVGFLEFCSLVCPETKKPAEIAQGGHGIVFLTGD
jgi:hypothetical protein